MNYQTTGLSKKQYRKCKEVMQNLKTIIQLMMLSNFLNHKKKIKLYFCETGNIYLINIESH